MKKKLLILILSIFTLKLFCQNQKAGIKVNLNSLPEIESLKPNSKNVIFAEFNSIVENNSKLINEGKAPEYLIFKYTNTENFTLLGLCSRCCINYDTIATINRIDSKEENINGKTLLIPTFQGLFIPLNGTTNSLEILLREYYNIASNLESYTSYNIQNEDFIFLQGKRFTSTQRFYFLDSSIQLPLDPKSFTISSEFGKRKNPFSGEFKNHNGIDMACSEGSPVYAVKDGFVSYTIENDKELGNYIILSHDQGKMTSVYAHLSKINVEQYKYVKKGDIIGFAGETGMATGPHLHFEIRQGGKAEDPRQKLNLKEY